MIIAKDNCFVLNTAKTSYVFHKLETGQLEHLYYGKRLHIGETDKIPMAEELMPLIEKRIWAPANTIIYDQNQEQGGYSAEDLCFEMSTVGKGDIREPFVEITYPDGSFTSDFVLSEYSINRGKEDFATLPGSYDEKGVVEHLTLVMQDRQSDLILELHYYVYEDCDVITRASKLINKGKESVKINRLASLQLDIDRAGFKATLFQGAWAREMEKTDINLDGGKLISSSYTGTSSNRLNSFFMLSDKTTDENDGECYGFNLIYSGNHYEAIDVSSCGFTRVVTGINPQTFAYILNSEEAFETPEAVMTYSVDGYNGMSQNMHDFVREHIVRGEWKKKDRPVLLNSWEAAYFDIDEDKLCKLAKAGKEAGVELFVVDDGWFGKRNDDRSSLGDWIANTEKLPNGLKGLADKIKDIGLDFGIWVEPEMVNTDSDLFRAHPDWTLSIPGKAHSEGRNQRILDMTRPEVQQYVIDAMSAVFDSADISYVKWDMNRLFSDYYSSALRPEQMGEVMHRYVCGLYKVMKTLTEKYPKILFEGCSSGGNRFDLGILCYFPQIWASDNTDAITRVNIQSGYSYGYPMSTVSAHVSAIPNHQTTREAPMETRYNVASFGVFGYECNLCEMTEDELARVKKHINEYKQYRTTLQYGRFYRGRTFGNITEWMCVAKDAKQAVGMIVQKLYTPNMQHQYFNVAGLDETAVYQVARRDSDRETYKALGSTLNNVGIKLPQEFGDYIEDAEQKFFRDYGSKMYYFNKL